MLKIRRSPDRLIVNMGIPILVRRHLYIVTFLFYTLNETRSDVANCWIHHNNTKHKNWEMSWCQHCRHWRHWSFFFVISPFHSFVLCLSLSHWMWCCVTINSVIRRYDLKLPGTYSAMLFPQVRSSVPGSTSTQRMLARRSYVPNTVTFWMVSRWVYDINVMTQRAPGVMITSLWRQNDVATSFWRHNDVILPRVSVG